MSEPLLLNLLSAERPTPEQTEILRAAKQASGVGALCKPVRAVPGCGRVLSFEGRPTFACEWCEPSGYDDPRLPRMIRWLLTGEGGKPYTVADWLSTVMGVSVVQTGAEVFDRGVRFRP